MSGFRKTREEEDIFSSPPPLVTSLLCHIEKLSFCAEMKLLLLHETPFYALKKDQRSEDIFGGESGFQDAEEGDLDDR